MYNVNCQHEEHLFGKGLVMDIKTVGQSATKLVDNIETVIKGKRQAVELAVTALLCQGHLLIEDVPGVGKTMLAKSIAKSLDGVFKRIQFTPDLLPSDITGASLFNQKTGDFEWQPGPVFGNIVLADEINRTTPRTQSALLEAMDERQVTIDGVTRDMPKPFFVIATQNPVEFHGTYPLPEGQLDRFLMSINLGYPSSPDEKSVVLSQQVSHPIETLKSVMHVDKIVEAQAAVKKVTIDETLIDYVLKITEATRRSDEFVLGASPRGTLSLVHTAQGYAAINGREYVLPDDIKTVAMAVLAHRVFVKPRLKTGEAPARKIIARILDEVPVPIVR
jgi:MoxR-like ATPase